VTTAMRWYSVMTTFLRCKGFAFESGYSGLVRATGCTVEQFKDLLEELLEESTMSRARSSLSHMKQGVLL